MAHVSIIMPNYNGGRFIEEAIRSVQDQGIQDWELLISDDCSVDGSTEIIRGIAERDSRVILLDGGETRSGPAKTRNRSIAAARGRFLAFLDSDDCWTSDKLEKQLALHERTGCALTFTALAKMDETGALVPGTIFGGESVTYRRMLERNYMPCSSVVVDRSKTGDFRMPDIYRRQDYALWLLLLRQGGVALGIREPLLYYRVYPSSFSASKFIGALYHWKVLRECEKVSLLSCAFYFMHYACASGFDYIKGRLALARLDRRTPQDQLPTL